MDTIETRNGASSFRTDKPRSMQCGNNCIDLDVSRLPIGHTHAIIIIICNCYRYMLQPKKQNVLSVHQATGHDMCWGNNKQIREISEDCVNI